MLVAVTAYPNLPPKNALIGPNHDAKLVRDYLTTRAPIKFEPANVTLLADGLDGAASSPTRDHILAALGELAGKVQRDDFVYLHYSGHGSQQPTLTPDTETDGLDEILLPADTSPWDSEAKRLPNALLDDEIGTALDAIRDKGAFVWIVVDACNSGSVTRAALIRAVEEPETDRKLDPTDADGLNIPASAMPAAETVAVPAGGERKSGLQLISESEGGERAVPLNGADQSQTSAEPMAKGGMVAFFAAQTIETTPEMPLPKGVPGAERFGLFTFTIFSKLAENPGMTYRQLGHSVLQQYAADTRQRPTPIFEGELDARVFGSEPTRHDHAMAGRGEGQCRDAPRRPAAPAHPRHQARHPADAGLGAIRDSGLSRGQVGGEPVEPCAAGRLRRQTGAETFRPSTERLCAALGTRRRF